MASDAALAEASIHGDPVAFGAIVDRYKTLVCSITYSETGNLSLSEELAQETFLTAWRKLDTLEEWGKLRAWLCGIARNVTRARMREERREPAAGAEALDVAEGVSAAERTPAEQAISQEEQDVLWRALERIPQAYREPMVLFYREQQSVRTVAEQLDLTEAVVKQRLSRGREKLRAEMTAFVEDALGRTLPGRKFTAAVVGALTVTGAKQAAAATVGAGMGTASVGLLGPILGLFGGLYGAWNDYREAKSARERRLIVVSICALLVYIAAWLLTFPLVKRLVGLWSMTYVELLMAWLGLGIGVLGGLFGVLMSCMNRMRLEGMGIDLNALRARPVLVEETWDVSGPSGMSLARAIVGIALEFSALAAFIFLWIALEYSLFEPMTLLIMLCVATPVALVIAAFWLWTSPKLMDAGRRHYVTWTLVLSAMLAAHFAAGFVLSEGMWKAVEVDFYEIVLLGWVLYGVRRARRLDKSGLMYAPGAKPQFVPGVPVRLARGRALVELSGAFIGATFWILVLAAMVGDWAAFAVVATSLLLFPMGSLRLFSPRYRVIMLADVVAAAVVSLAVVSLRWNAWMAIYTGTRFYRPVNHLPLWVMDLTLGLIFVVFIGALILKISHESKGEKENE